MGLWQNIRNYFYRSNLNKRLEQVKPTRTVINLADAKCIGILYDSTDSNNDSLITRFAEGLRNHQGKEVELLGYVNDTKTESKTGISVFNKKNLSWAGVPRGQQVEEFALKKFDLLLACFPAENISLEYISYISHARWRVGAYANDKTFCYDLMINIGERKELDYLLEQMVSFLNQIKYDKN